VRGDGVESYKFNQRNNLTSYCQTEYTYDAEGNRIKVTDGKEEIRYLYDTNQSLPKVIKSTKNGLSTIYIYGKDLISEKSGKDTSYYHFDYRGSTVALTDITGKITDKYQYDVYGSSRHTEGISETPFRYNGSAGVMTDSNNLLYMKSRYYDINTSRFISADVITGDIRNTQSLNRYTYCEGNPVNFTDPFGLSPEVKAKKQAQIEAEKRELISEKIHGILDVAGMAPLVVGMAADGLNGVIYIFEGDLIGASFSAIAFIPAVGEISTPTKHGGKLALATASSGADNVAKMAGRYRDDAAELIVKESNSLINKVDNVIDDFEKVEELKRTNGSFGDLMSPEEKVRYNKYFGKKSISQPMEKNGEYIRVSPGTKYMTGYYDNAGKIEPWEAWYDEFGRELVRNDYNSFDPTVIGKTGVHHHKYHLVGNNWTKIDEHFEGKYIWSIYNNPSNGW